MYKTTSLLGVVTTYDRKDRCSIQCSVNGERNSGTTFLATLLREHGLLVFDGLCIYNLQLLWKHDFPSPALKFIGKSVINFFIIRDLDSWLVTTYHKPHHLLCSQYQPFYGFLYEKHYPRTGPDEALSIETFKPINHTDENKTIFEIRYEKIKAYLKYFNENDNVVIVKLSYLQNEKNCIHFMQEITKKYGLNITNFKGGIDVHTKSNERNLKNIKYPTKITPLDRYFINLQKDDEIENYVNNLTFEMK